LSPEDFLPIHTGVGNQFLNLLNYGPEKMERNPVKKLKSDYNINKEVDADRGKSTGWPQCMTYSLKNGISRVVLAGKINKTNLRKMDCWGLAFLDY
jgi:hypothetical protein